MSTTNVKARHYAALSASLRNLKTNLAESEVQFAHLSEVLDHMQRLGSYHGAQFMAVSRMIDIELDEVEKRRLSERDATQGS